MMDLEDRIAKIIKDEYEAFTGGHADGGHADVAAHEIMALIEQHLRSGVPPPHK